MYSIYIYVPNWHAIAAHPVLSTSCSECASPDSGQHRRRDGPILGQEVQPHPSLCIHKGPAGLLVLPEAQHHAASWRRLRCSLAGQLGRTGLRGCAGHRHRAAREAEDGGHASTAVADLLGALGRYYLHTCPEPEVAPCTVGDTQAWDVWRPDQTDAQARVVRMPYAHPGSAAPAATAAAVEGTCLAVQLSRADAAARLPDMDANSAGA